MVYGDCLSVKLFQQHPKKNKNVFNVFKIVNENNHE